MNYLSQKQKLLMRYPAVEDLALKARKRIPPVAWEYLITGTGRESLIERNIDAFDEITLNPQFCKGPSETTLFGQKYSAPFGIAPIGLTGLMWPKAELIMARAAAHNRLPYTLSTLATETPETVGPLAGEMGWFQLYPPREPELRKTLLDRAWNSGFRTLVVTADVPTPSRRERTKRAGLGIPPKITPSFIWQGITHPNWSLATLKRGIPNLRTVADYSEFRSMMSVGEFVEGQLGGNLSWEYCRQLRDIWQGPIVIKGLLHPQDALEAHKIGMDGIIVSNHGGRQVDGSVSSIEMLPAIAQAIKDKIPIILDSGIRGGADTFKALALGAKAVCIGRPYVYGLATAGEKGVSEVLQNFLADFDLTMGLAGCKSISEIDVGCLKKA